MLSKLRSIFSNPIFIKDYNINKRRRKGKEIHISSFFLLVISLSLPFFLLGLLIRFSGVGWEHFCANYSSIGLLVIAILQFIYFAYKSISCSFSLFSIEREHRTLDGLISTLLTPDDIILGKFMVAFFPLFLELTGYLPLMMSLGFLFCFSQLKILLIYFITLIFISFFTVLGLYCSLSTLNTQKANSRAVLISGFMIIGTLVIDGIICSLLGMMVPVATMLLNPMASLWAVIYAGSMHFRIIFILPALLCPVMLIAISSMLWVNMRARLSNLPGR